MNKTFVTYGVDSYHINIGTGDAALHLLVCIEYDDQGDTISKTWIDAILVDAGYYDGHADGDTQHLDALLGNINAKYTNPNPVEVSHIVITHWDEDHFSGLTSLFERCMNSNLKPGKNFRPDTYKPSILKDFGNGAGNYLIGPDGPNNGVLYNVRWAEKIAPVIEYAIDLEKAGVDYVDNEDRPTDTPILIVSSIKSQFPIYRRGLFCIGQNLLKLTKTNPVADYKTVTSPEELLKQNPPDDTHGVGMYIVAAGCCVIGFGNLSAVATNPNPGARVPADNKNNSSIAIMVIFKRPDGSAQISHYFAGDLGLIVEQYLVDWTNKTKPHQVQTIKLSHHGATDSTPLNMLKTWKPRNVIISAGKAATYGHPRWEMILLLHEYAKWVKANDPNHNVTLLTTMYPYYLVRGLHTIQLQPEVISSDFNVLLTKSSFSMFLTNAPVPIGFRQELEDLSNNLLVKGVVQEFNEVAPNFWKQREFILRRTEAAFDDLSESIVGGNAIRWVLAESREDILYPVPSQISLHDIAGNDKFTSRYQQNQKAIIHQANANTHVFHRMAAMRQLEQKRGVLHGRMQFSQFPTYGQEFEKPGTGRATIMADLGVRGHPDLRYIQEGYSMDEKDSQDRTSSSISDKNDKPNTNNTRRAAPTITGGSAGSISSDESSFYLYSSDVRPFDGAINIQALTSAGSATEKVLNEFAMALHRGVLGLKGRPTANSLIELDADDEWFLWMQKSLSAEKLSMVSDDKSLGSSFVLSLPFNQTYQTRNFPLPIDSPLLIPPGIPGATQPEPVATSSGSLGIFPDRNFMVLALDESKVVDEPNLDLGEVLRRSRLESEIPALNSLAMAFLKALPLKLDTTPDARNLVTFFPEANYLTVVRNQYVSTTQAFNDFLKWMDLEEKYFSIEEITLITKKKLTWTIARAGTGVNVQPEVILGLTCRLKPSGVGAGYAFTGALRIMDGILELTIILQDGLPVSELLTWAVDALKLKDFTLGDILQNAKNLKTPQPRRVAITFGLKNDGSISGIRAVNIDLTMSFQTAKSPVLTLFTYQWTQGRGSSFTGSLWCSEYSRSHICAISVLNTQVNDSIVNMLTVDLGVAPSRYASFLPDYEPLLQIQAPKPEEQSTSLDLKDLFQSDIIQNIPEGLPTKIIRATMTVTKDSISFGGTIVTDAQQTKDAPMPRLQLSSLSLDIFYDWTLKDVSAEVQIRVALLPPTSSIDPPAEMGGYFRYESSKKLWKMRGYTTGLKMSNLYSLFDSTSQDAVMEVMQAITIRSLDLQYGYSGSSGSQFVASAEVVLGGLLFALTYEYKSGGVWHVQANLSSAGQAADEHTTIGALIQDVTGSDTQDLAIPSFLGDIEIKKPDPSTGLLGLYCSKTPNTSKADTPSNEGICFVVYGMIESLVFTFTQFKSTLSAKDISSGTKDVGSRKRVIKASMVSLPKLDIPLIGALTQPFDEMYFLWVQDATQGESVIKGLTAADVKQINSQYDHINGTNPSTAAKIPQLLYKQPSSANKDPDPTAVVIEAGWHFVLVLKDEKGQPKIVLDYVFGKTDVSKTSGSATKDVAKSSSVNKGDTVAKEKTESPNGPASLAPMKKNQGPLSFERIGFEFKDEVLSLLLDAKLALGPLEFSLIGLKINMNLRDVEDPGDSKPKRVTLQTIKPKNFSLSLEGIAVSFDKPPIKVAGKFVSSQYGDIKYYAGGIIIGFEPWMFQAAGMYGFKTVNGHEIKNVFVFLKLDGPLITVGFADISGLTGGLGYNMDLKWPSVTEVTDFPFISGGSSDTDPMKQLDALTKPGGWITPVEDVMWCAVGMKVAAFKVMSVDAVVIVQWSPSVRLAVFGVAVIDVPSTKAKKKFAHVELGIAATVDPGAGVMKLEAQLSPNSFILDPSCHLSGGFAMYSWWTPLNPQIEASPDNHAGDWVLTIGGYHRNFAVPAHYPQPDRLQISWSLGNTLSITGQAYFAITPKCCMGGGRLQATLSVGLLSAWFDAYVDFLVNYEPFRFIGDGGLTIGVKFTLDLWLITIHISVEISASLHIEGPPVRGYVHVDFYVFGFDIAFGAEDKDRRVDVPLVDFYDAVLQNTNGAKLSAPAIKGLNEAHTFTCLSGIIPPNSKEAPDATAPWLVKPGNLAFSISCKFAVNDITVLGEPVTLTGVDRLYAKPMQLQSDLHSIISVDIFSQDEDPTSKKQSKRALPTKPEEKWIRSTRTQRLPSGLYGYYDPSLDPLSPSSKGNNVAQLLQPEGATSTLTTEIQISPPQSQPSSDKLAKYNAAEGFRQFIYSGPKAQDDHSTKAADEKNFPDCPAVSPKWNPELPDQDNVTHYKAIANAWKTAQKSDTCLTAIADALGWRVVNPGLKDLSAAPPNLLLDHFDDLSIAAPVFCSA